MARDQGELARRVSVVINTYNRGASLRQTLKALRYQTYAPFEVVAVNGPSADDTLQVLAEFPDVRVASCPEVKLGKSRNIGIAEAAGEIVAFIDDDSVPEPRWLEELLAAYDAPQVGGAGGLVYDHTGVALQYRYASCSRLGITDFEVGPPFDRLVKPGADPFLYLQGTNCSFRRDCLVEIGGFDEEIEHIMDETDVCMRLLDRGYLLRPLDGAAVHHKYLASHLRTSKKAVLDPFPDVKTFCYLLVANNRERLPLEELKARAQTLLENTKRGAWEDFKAGRTTAAQRDHCIRQAERGVVAGLERGLSGRQPRRPIPPANPALFRPFHTLQPAGKRLKICFVSQEYPPEDFGGIGRFTADLALGFAASGHEVHVVTRCSDIDRIDFEEGVWLHRLPAPDRWLPAAEGLPLAGCLYHAAAAYNEVCRIHEKGPLDLVSAPLWACEGTLCLLDERFPTVLTLTTLLRTIAGMHPSWADEGVRQATVLEELLAREARFLHPISQAILDKLRSDYGDGGGKARVVPLGLRDQLGQFPRQRSEDGRVQVLFVGRLERRKGVDVLLEAARKLLKRFPDLDFILAGKETLNTEIGCTYREEFEREHGTDPELIGRVKFTGAISDEQLYRLYSDSDIVCLPSRYESLGLVLIEGMMFGKPVVGCKIGGMCEIVEEGKNGFLAEPESAESLANCLARLVGDPEARRSFGQRSRELYETRYALPVVVENTAHWYAEIARAGAGVGTGSPLVERLAKLIARAASLADEVAREIAEGLLDPDCYPVDYLAKIRPVWHRPPAEFVSGLYKLLFKRDPEPGGLAYYLERLQAGMPREEVVRSLVKSEEMKKMLVLSEIPTAWVDSLELLGTWRHYLSGGPKAVLRRLRNSSRRRLRSRSAAHRLLPRVRIAACVGNALRYVKRLALLPWNFQRVHDSVGRFEELALMQKRIARQIQEAFTLVRRDAIRYQAEVRQLSSRCSESCATLAREQERQAATLQRLAEALGEARNIDDVIDLKTYRATGNSLGGEVRLNLDAARSEVDGLTAAPNAVPGVDVAALPNRLPHPLGSVAEIAAGRIVERFALEQLETVLLPHWKDLLRDGGVLRLACVNWEATIRALQAGEVGSDEFQRVLLTSPLPRATYTAEALAALLRRHGFDRVEVVAHERPCGPWREIEVSARKNRGEMTRPALRTAV